MNLELEHNYWVATYSNGRCDLHFAEYIGEDNKGSHKFKVREHNFPYFDNRMGYISIGKTFLASDIADIFPEIQSERAFFYWLRHYGVNLLSLSELIARTEKSNPELYI